MDKQAFTVHLSHCSQWRDPILHRILLKQNRILLHKLHSMVEHRPCRPALVIRIVHDSGRVRLLEGRMVDGPERERGLTQREVLRNIDVKHKIKPVLLEQEGRFRGQIPIILQEAPFEMLQEEEEILHAFLEVVRHHLDSLFQRFLHKRDIVHETAVAGEGWDSPGEGRTERMFNLRG